MEVKRELKRYLYTLNLKPYSRGNITEGTELISKSVEYFCKYFKLRFEREVFLGLRRPSSNYRGFVDFVIWADTCKYALEIDRSDKRWSLDKLTHSSTRGYTPIWIRWYNKVRIGIPENVFLIDLSLVENDQKYKFLDKQNRIDGEVQNMNNAQALLIIQKLADGIDPHTGEIFPMDSPYQHPDTVRALHMAIPALERAEKSRKRRKSLPENAGKPWTPEEDKQLIASYKAGKSIKELSKLHKRTSGAISSRLLQNGIFG